MIPSAVRGDWQPPSGSLPMCPSPKHPTIPAAPRPATLRRADADRIADGRSRSWGSWPRAVSALTGAVQVSSAYTEGYGTAIQHGRVSMERITRKVREATANENFPGAAGVLRPGAVVATFRTRWWCGIQPACRPIPAGLPLYGELVTFLPRSQHAQPASGNHVAERHCACAGAVGRGRLADGVGSRSRRTSTSNQRDSHRSAARGERHQTSSSTDSGAASASNWCGIPRRPSGPATAPGRSPGKTSPGRRASTASKPA